MTHPSDRSREKVSFRPIHSGLGFHPFSDGLPYAPVSKTRTTPKAKTPPEKLFSGSGAMTAGPPTLATPKMREEAKIALGQTNSASTPVQILWDKPSVPGLFYLFRRGFAYTIDSLINLFLCSSAFFLLVKQMNIPLKQFMDPTLTVLTFTFFFVFNWAIIASQEIIFHTTIGKRLFGIHLEGSTVRIFLRALIFIPSTLLLGFGLLWAFLGKERKCWHDSISGIQPQEIAKIG